MRFTARSRKIWAPLRALEHHGEMIPLKALIRMTSVVGPEQVERYNGFLSAKVLGSGKPGISSGQTIAAVEKIASQALPPGYGIAWTGQAYQEKRTGSASVFAFGFAIVMVYLILAALYERWRLPVAVVLAVRLPCWARSGSSGCAAWKTTSISRSVWSC